MTLPQRLFVTGGTGFIGSHFLNAAHAQDVAIRALRRSAASLPRVKLDRDPQWLDRTMDTVSTDDLAGCDCLVHLAAHTPNVPYDTLENCLHWNLTVPLRLFRTAVAAGIKRFVVAGSCFEYGRAGERYEFIPPDAPLEPTQSYPASKAAASVAFCALAAETGIRLSIQRIFQVFGEGEEENRLWPSLRRAALAGEDFPMTAGEQIRDFIPVEQVAARLLAACSTESLEAGIPLIENLGTGCPRTVRQFADFWWQSWHAAGQLQCGALPYRAGEVMRYVPLVAPHSLADTHCWTSTENIA